MNLTFRALFVATAAAILVSGCTCGDATVTSIAVTPASASIERGKTAAFKATATFSDKTTRDVTADANWSIAEQAVASVSNTAGSKGTVTGSTVGATKVKAAFSAGGKNAEGEADVTVTAPPAGTIVVTPRTGLVTTEAGGTATFTAVLSDAPTDTVTITLSSSDLTEGTVSPAVLIFTTTNWNAAQTVTVTGVDDTLVDGAQAYKVVLAPAVSNDVVYNNVDGGSVDVSNTDNDSAGITVTPTTGLVTTEGGGSATFTVVLNSQPTGNVTIGLASNDATEGTAAPNLLTFTAQNWNAAQTVTVTGVDDTLADGNQTYTIVTAPAVSSDTGYSGVNPSDVSVSNTDNDTAGITVFPTSGLTTTESGGTATFTVVLTAQPSGNVTIALSSSNTNEGTVSPAALTFTPANFGAQQIVTVTGVNDNAVDGSQTYTIVTAAAVSTDTGYNNLNPADVGCTNTDNDSAGVTVTPVSGLTTTEGGGTATFTVVLNSVPTANVTIALSSNNTGEATVAPAALTFTPANYAALQTVTVTGVNDAVADGNQSFTIVTANATSTDTGYNNLAVADVTGTNIDNDSSGITVAPTTGLTTTEAGGFTTFAVVLNSQPTANVTIALSSSNTNEGTVSPAALTFTTVNWNGVQTVTVTGVNDAVADGPQTYTIVTAPATSGDATYNNVNGADVTVINTDNDSPGVSVNPTAGLVTSESGTQATFTVVLNSQPTGNVTIGLSSSNTNEGTVSPAALTFTSVNWNANQTVTLTGVNDAAADGTQSYTIVTAQATSSDVAYAAINPADVSASNVDNDSAGVTVNPTSGLVTSETGTQATFTVVLNSQPSTNVTISLTSSLTTEGTVSPAALTFTNLNWNGLQTVTVTGADDSVADGARAYSIITGNTVSSDVGYNGAVVADVSVTNNDNDSAGFTVNPTTGLVTTEAGGTATFTVRLNSQPTGNVTIGLSSNNTAEATVAPAALTFTSVNWNGNQTVTVTGVDDAVQDGPQSFIILTAAAISTDLGYSGQNPTDVTGSNTDNDSAGYTVNPTSGLTTTEAGGQATFTVRLNSQPTANVTISLASNNTAEGTVSPAALTFTNGNWNANQTVTITGVDDAVQDGLQAYSIITGNAVSADLNFNGGVVSDVTVSNSDNDTSAVIVNPTSGLITNESGLQATFTVVLQTQPTANVTINLSSNNTGEGTVSPAALTFTNSNWNGLQTVTITGVNDVVIDGPQTYSIVTSNGVSTDGNYGGILVADVSVTNNDNDTAGFTISKPNVVTNEAGAQDTFTVSLSTQPTSNVTIPVSSNNTNEATVSPAALTFTPANWNGLQTVTVTGVDDLVADGAQGYLVVLGLAQSSDGFYLGQDPTDVIGSNVDNDSAGITVIPNNGLTTSENGGQALFTVVLNSQPTAPVTIPLVTGDTTEGSVSPSALTFTTLNWNAAQIVTVTGVDDAIQDGQQPYTVVTQPAQSSDLGYQGFDAINVNLINTDNDTPGITVFPTVGLNTTEAGGTATFQVVLNSPPGANVTIPVFSADTTEGVASPGSLTFTSANWNAPQTVLVTGVDDAVADGLQPYSITIDPASSGDIGYAGLNASDVFATNTDNDSAGITVNPTSGLVTTEGGGQDTFTIVLNSQPTANVTIALSSNDTTEGTVSPAALTFTPANWNGLQTVTVTGADDAVADGTQGYTIITGAASSADTTGYSGLNPTDVLVNNTDNDSAGITVNPLSGLITTEAGGQAFFTIVLNSQPTANVTISVIQSDSTEGSVSPTSLTFTPANWNGLQTVTVTGVDDAVADGSQPYTVITQPAVSSDLGYSTRDALDVSVVNIDNDSAGITVTPIISLITTEGGGQDTFTVVLNSQPTANVTITMFSSDSTEGSISPTAVTFTPANWNSLQTVTITGLDDAVADGTQPYAIVTNPATSADTTGYSGMNAFDVSVANLDNDTAGITVTPARTPLVTSEGGGFDNFTVVLNSQPTANVTIQVFSNDSTEGTATPTFLTFTPANWNGLQTVTVNGVDDAVADGLQPYTIITNPAVSSDTTGYSGMDPADVAATNVDNDSAGVTVTPTSGLVTTEPGGQATFTVRLNSQPTADVTISLASNDSTEGSVSPAALTFTTSNWNGNQTVTITGLQDSLADGPQLYSIITGAGVSADATGYSGITVANVSVTNTDDDTASINVSPTSGLFTSEGGLQTSFDIVLNSQPTANVTIQVFSNDSTEGTASPTFLTFTPSNWNGTQTVTLFGVDDLVADGLQAYSITTNPAVSGDTTGYSGMNAADVSVSNIDNDTAGINIVPTSAAVTTEPGGTATFTVALNSQPTADVTIPLNSSNTLEGTVSPAALTFTALNYLAPQTVTATGVQDLVADGNIGYLIRLLASNSSDGNYNNVDAPDYAMTNNDDDTAGFVINPTSGLATSEAGGQAVFTVRLQSQPLANVTINLSSSVTTEGTVAPAALTFTTANWNSNQAVIITGVDDALRDGNQPYQVVTSAANSSDGTYNGIDPTNVSVINVDNDSPAIGIAPVSGIVTNESGLANSSFDVVLLAPPTANVTIQASSSDSTEGAVLPSAITFTTANWNIAQTIQVIGIDDFIIDGNQPYSIITAPAVSSDLGYQGLNPADVTCTNVDND